MKHEMKLRPIYFEKIKSGEKIFEIRLNDEKRQQIKVGDVLVFKKEPLLEEKIQTTVKDLVYFESFDEMAKSLPSKQIGFENMNIGKIVETYHQFYSTDDEKKYGVLAIKVEIN